MEANTTLEKIEFFDRFKDKEYVVDDKNVIVNTLQVQGVLPEGEVLDLEFLVKRINDKCVICPIGTSSLKFYMFKIFGERVCEVTRVKTKAKNFIASKNEDDCVTFEFVEEDE